jgi:mono/diheme cytochrome c family protein
MRARPAHLRYVVIVLTLGAPALAHADATNGEQLARQRCASCHVVGTSPPQGIQQGPPSFRSVAQSGMSADQLRTFLAKPHGGNPDWSLTRSEIDDLNAYIDKLR